MTNSARAEIDQSLAWARNESTEIVTRARAAAEQLLSAAGLGGAALDKVVSSIAPGGRPESAAGDSESRSSTTQTSGTPPTPPSGGQSAG
jgi:hypothetical protein